MVLQIPGRQNVAHRLESAIAEWRKGHGAVLFIEGDTSVGKSFVLDAVESALGDQAVRVDCRPPIGSFNVASVQPLQPFGLAIERLYQAGEAAARKRLAVNIGMSVLASLPIAGDIFYAIKAVKQDVSEFKRETAALAQKKRAAVDECLETLAAIGEHSPFVLLVDDGHWSDPQSVDVLRALASDPRNRLLIIWAYSPRLAQSHNLPLTSLVNAHAATLAPITLGSIEAQHLPDVIHAIAPSLSIDPALLPLLFERTAGLPGIIAEYIRYLQHTGAVSADGHVDAEAINTIGVNVGDHPATDVLVHQVKDNDALLLSICAAEGREFSAFMVAALTNKDVIATVRELRLLGRTTGIIRSCGMRTRYGVKTTIYTFDSDVAYTYFLHYATYEERKAIHQRIAEILQQQRSQSDIDAVRDQLAVLIAAHGLAADEVDLAAAMLQESHRAAIDIGAHQSAAIILSELQMQVAGGLPVRDDAPTPDAGDSSMPIEHGAVTSYREAVRKAADAVIEGNGQLALSIAETSLESAELTTSERVILCCLAARALAMMDQMDRAEHYVQLASSMAGNTASDMAIVLNVRALLAHANNKTEVAMSLLQDAARIVSKGTTAAQILTVSNVYSLDAHRTVASPQFVRTLKKNLSRRNWQGVARDLGLLTLLIVSLMAPRAIAAQERDRRIHASNIERAHPTPVPELLNRATALKVPFVQAEEVFPSQFSNASMIEPEADVQPMQNESSIAVNPRNPRNLIGSAVDYRAGSQTWAYVSTNAGQTWRNISLGHPYPGWRSTNDPSVCFDHLGRGYLCYGAFNVGNTPQFGENGVFVSITDDGGTSWGPTHVAVIEHRGTQTADSAFEDKYYIHVDTATSSPYRGTLYIPWKRVINRDSSTQIVLARSTDRGLTWQQPVAVGNRFPGTSEHPTFGQSFPLARTGPDGSVHVVWNSGTESAVRYARSTDGGSTFASPRIVHTYKPFGEKREVAGSVNSRVKGVVRAEAYPTMAIDNTGGQRNGWLYLVWSADNPPNVYFSRSTDNGTTWSEPVIIHSDTTNDQFWPWIAIDPTSGHLAVMFFDSRDDESNILVNCYVSHSTDGGTTWVDRRVGDAENDLRNNPFTGRTFAGDYSGCDFYNGIVYPSWVDMRNTTEVNTVDSDVFTAIVNTKAPEAPETFTAAIVADVPTAIDLRWSAVDKRVFGEPLSTQARYELHREGERIAVLEMGTLAWRDVGLEAFKEYRYTLRVIDGSDTSTSRNASTYAGGSREPGAPTLLAIRGRDDGSILVTVTLPNKRLDGETPLINLDALSFSVGDATYVEEVSSSDTGTTKEIVIPSFGDGWYHVAVRSVDGAGNTSPWSDTLTTFTGNVHWRSETFDTLPRFLSNNSTWGLSTGFAFTPPHAYTDSPGGDYERSRRDTILLYPFQLEAAIPEHNALVITCRVAAFIDPSDTAFLDVHTSGGWRQLFAWNASVDARWTDTTKSADAWRTSTAVLPLSSDTLQLRIRFRTNLQRHSDGLYLDDVTWQTTTTVLDEVASAITAYPLPARDRVTIVLPTEVSANHCVVYTSSGTSIQTPWHQDGSVVSLDVAHLPSGVYRVTISSAKRTIVQRIMVMR